MKLPRLRQGALCYSLETWTIRSCIFHIAICILLAGVFFYTTTKDTNSGQESKSKGVLMGLGVICCIPLAFTTLLLIGTLQNNILFLRISILYGFIQVVVYSAFFLYVSIYAFVNTGIEHGFVLLCSTVLIAGYMIYNNLVVHSIYMNLKERELAMNNIDTAQHI